jgi:ribonuclease III
MSLSKLTAALGHSFADRALLQTALTHRSFGASNNERLEFIGDGVLNCVIAVALFRRYPDLDEGDLSRMRANLVRQDTLHRLAVALHLGDSLRLGEGELKSGGNQRPSILADTVEALIGAVYLDGGFEAAQALIGRLYLPMFDELTSGAVTKDAKTTLQEWLQARKRPLPRYEIIEASGAAHEQRFAVACEIENPRLRTIGQASSRRLAEQAAADRALKALKA